MRRARTRLPTRAAWLVGGAVGPALAGAVASAALGAPFVIAGTIKAAYDVVLWSWFRHVPLPEEVSV